ncbi:PepSY domain-containing protein [Rhodobacterales bacterium FZCC0083]|nr:PepSY domain-containing protein [Rhodobacterales bacterium FZCC0083]
MRRHITYTAAILLASRPAYADFVQTKIDEFFTQGYTHFEVERGTVKSKIEGYSATGEKIEVVIDNVTGAVIREYTETANDDDTRQIIKTIETRYNDSDDDDDDDRDDDDDDDDD